ncbi:MAG TPA: hypothetical protein VMB19_08750 [Silvibacterium sp.]|nr:hypothetical protein [Silvibacterium sp.]
MAFSRGTASLSILALGVAVSVPAASASKNFEKPVARTAINYPAHDFHRDVKLSFAADPYDVPEKAKIFSVDFAGHGFLPVFLVVTNDGDRPISIANMEITLITQNHSKLTPAAPEDIYRRLSNPHGGTRPSPIPIPRSRVKGSISPREMDEIESAQFAARAIEPHTTQSGFLFFDVEGISSPLRGANLDITGVEDANGNEIMYFEIAMDKYLNAPVNP